MKNALTRLLAVCALAGTALSVLAQHSTSATCDTSTIVFEGVVIERVYAFLYVPVYFDVTDADGKVAERFQRFPNSLNNEESARWANRISVT